MEPGAWLALSVVFVLGAMSPGPSLAVVLRNTMAGGRNQGVATGIGHGIGFGIYAFAAAAGARTFGFLPQARALRARGLIAGAGLENVLVFDGEGRVQNPAGARWPNEPARHKWLDLVGDLRLLGDPIRAAIVATCAGHALHHQLVGALLRRRRS